MVNCILNVCFVYLDFNSLDICHFYRVTDWTMKIYGLLSLPRIHGVGYLHVKACSWLNRHLKAPGVKDPHPNSPRIV